MNERMRSPIGIYSTSHVYHQCPSDHKEEPNRRGGGGRPLSTSLSTSSHLMATGLASRGNLTCVTRTWVHTRTCLYLDYRLPIIHAYLRFQWPRVDFPCSGTVSKPIENASLCSSHQHRRRRHCIAAARLCPRGRLTQGESTRDKAGRASAQQQDGSFWTSVGSMPMRRIELSSQRRHRILEGGRVREPRGLHRRPPAPTQAVRVCCEWHACT